MTKLTEAQVREMAELRERGWSTRRLADRYGVTAGAIHYRCLVAGALSPRSQGIVAPDKRRPMRGFGGTCVPFSAEEDLRLLRLARSGVKIDAIAEQLQRARSSVRVRLLTLELKSEAA